MKAEFMNVITEQKGIGQLEIEIEELEAKIAPDGGETVVGLVGHLPKKPKR